MKNFYRYMLIAIAYIIVSITHVSGQCGPGYTQSQLNWDWLDFLPSNNTNYTDWYDLPLPSTRGYIQTFSIGTRRVDFTMASTTNFTLNGENSTNTAHTGSFAIAGDDVQFTTTTTSNRTITMTFDTEVTNVMFSLFDLDNNQRVTIAAVNSTPLAVPALLTKANILSGIVIVGQQATGPGSDYGNSDNNGTLNVQILGPVQTITLTLSNANGDIWLSDIDACVTGSFPSNWRNISRPFTGMPSYILTVVDNRFMLLDPATGKAKDLFTDPGHTNMNGMGYDPVNRILYYTYSLTSPAQNTRTIYKYSVDTDNISTFISDVRAAPLNIPIYDPGVTSGSASFYNGSLYFGVEASNSNRTSGRENTVWKIDLDASQNPLRASQVYAARVDSLISGNNRLIHDWADIGVTNGIIYDFDGAGTGTANLDTMYYHFNMMSGQRIQYLPNGSGNIGPKQVAIDWQENIYNMGSIPVSSTGASSAVGFIAPYNYNGTINVPNTRLVYTMPGTVYPTGSWGDCSEAFRPTCDFGDAPATYDPDPWSPAVHERDTAIRIGATWDREWNKLSSALANGDGADEDGMSWVPIFSPGAGNYLGYVNVYNNTGETATLIAWLDFNGNGLFDTGEACQAQAAVASMPSLQGRFIYWPSAPTSLPNGSFTYLRIRLVRGSAGMTNANPTGYYDHGETEDYRVVVDNFPLKASLLTFNAKMISSDNVELKWTSTDEENFNGYEIQRSGDDINWNRIGFSNAKGNGLASEITYLYNDLQPLTGKSFYRLKLISNDNKFKYSDVRVISNQKGVQQITLLPNPSTDKAWLVINTLTKAEAMISVTDMSGRILDKQKSTVQKGINKIDLSVADRLMSGTYIIRIEIENEFFIKKLVIKKE